MEISNEKCLSCGKMIQMWRCGETAGGGTYHIVCLECNEKDSRQTLPVTSFWRWVGWTMVTTFMIAMLFVFLVFGGQ